MDVLVRMRQFFAEDIWLIDVTGGHPLRRLLLVVGQIGSRVGRDFFADRCLLRASALTFTSLLSFVPMLALMFAVLKGFGVQNRLEPLLLENLAVGSEEVVVRIIEYINNTNVGRLGTIGLVFLIMTVLTLLSNIEDSFNSIWYVRETRSLMRRFADYFSVVTLAPIFLLAAVSMTASIESQAVVQELMGMAYVGKLIYFLFSTLPYVAMWAAFAFLYLFMPNIKVRIPAAIIGGILGGTLWQVCQWAYVNFQVGVAKYNAIYGTMAALPIFMVWVYFSWMIVLLGLEVTYAWQNLNSLRQDLRGGEVSFASREWVALTLMLAVGRAFLQGEGAPGQEQLAESLNIPPRLSRQLLGELVALRLLSEVRVTDDSIGYQPARALETLGVYEVLQAIEEDGVDLARAQGAESVPERQLVAAVAERLRQAGEQSLAGESLRDLLQKLPD